MFNQEAIMDILNLALSILGPTLIAKTTVPLYGGIKKISKVVDRLPGPLHQLGVLGIASGLTWLGGALNVALPTNLIMFNQDSTAALIAGGMAYAMHAGSKQRRQRF